MRFHLTFSYALFFSVLLIGIAWLFRERLASSLDDQVHAVLDQEWAAMKGYLRIERDGPHWYYDEHDPDESFIVERLRRVYLLADSKGKMIQASTDYQNLGIDSTADIKAALARALAGYQRDASKETFWTVRRDTRGAPYLIRAGIVFDEGHHAPFYVAIGTPLTNNFNIMREFTLACVGVILAALPLGLFFGWFTAGRALEPVLAVAQTAQRISGSNLSLRIPTRKANDELDYLILTFNRMIERLEASFQQMKQFTADVSHELRTPITGIRGQLEVALFTAKTTDHYKEAIINALQDIDRLSQLVRALLMLSQAESGQLALQKGRLDLSGVVRNSVEQFQVLAEAEGVHLSAEVPPACSADLDRVQIERMLTNLLSNAIKFTPQGGSVRVTLNTTAEGVELAVDDTGRGIAKEYLPHIFDRFYRVPGAGSAPGPDQGLGLGLSFVSWIVKAHHGSIDVESTPGRGTRFTIHLPVDREQPNPVEPPVPIMNEL
ncbi:MAG: HAMP domain-containing protein [Acidobacteriia bacterium]|nr:HAMP domain-containing protein [Terriglobia bacterium]